MMETREQPQTCKQCGKSIPAGRRGNIRIYCSDRCRLLAWQVRHPHDKVKDEVATTCACVICGENYRPNRPWQTKTCGLTCRAEYNRRQAREHMRERYKTDPERFRARSRASYRAHPERYRVYNQRWAATACSKCGQLIKYARDTYGKDLDPATYLCGNCKVAARAFYTRCHWCGTTLQCPPSFARKARLFCSREDSDCVGGQMAVAVALGVSYQAVQQAIARWLTREPALTRKEAAARIVRGWRAGRIAVPIPAGSDVESPSRD